LDAESERALSEIRQRAGLSVSGALKRGLVAVREALRSEAAASPYEIYRTIDLGPGGYARMAARRAKAGVGAVLRARSRRDSG
jgi:hypothetical protein